MSGDCVAALARPTGSAPRRASSRARWTSGSAISRATAGWLAAGANDRTSAASSVAHPDYLPLRARLGLAVA